MTNKVFLAARLARVAALTLVATMARPSPARVQPARIPLQSVVTDLNVQITEVKDLGSQPGIIGRVIRMKWTVSHPQFIQVLGFTASIDVQYSGTGARVPLSKSLPASAVEAEIIFPNDPPNVPQHFKAHLETRFKSLAPSATLTSSGQFVLTKSNNFDARLNQPSPAGPLVRLTEVKSGPQGLTATWVATDRAGLEYTAFQLAGDAVVRGGHSGGVNRQVSARASGSARQALLTLSGGPPLPSGDDVTITVNLTITGTGSSTSVTSTDKEGNF